MSASKILWPDDLFGQVEETPLKILKEQASSLSERSNHRLRALIRLPSLVTPKSKFRVERPGGAASASRWEKRKLNSDYEFVDWLRNVLQSAETKRIVSALFSQANA